MEDEHDQGDDEQEVDEAAGHMEGEAAAQNNNRRMAMMSSIPTTSRAAGQVRATIFWMRRKCRRARLGAAGDRGSREAFHQLGRACPARVRQTALDQLVANKLPPLKISGDAAFADRFRSSGNRWG